ncbi:MAG: TPM domain-containing protein [Verrucomicrobiota bacterium]
MQNSLQKSPSSRTEWRNGWVALKRGLLLLLGLALVASCALAAEVIPPAPKAYFNDGAGVTRPETARQLNRELEQFERDTSNQIVVAVYPRMQSDSSIEDYTVRVAQAWHAGQKGRNNGAVLFVFIQNRKMFIQVGYGLEGALTDFLCNQIINNELKPRFRAGDFDGGLAAAVHAMIAATKGEYKGTGQTAGHRQPGGGIGWGALVVLFLIVMAVSRFLGRFFGGGPGGFSGGGPIIFGGGGGSGGGGGFSGGGFDGGGGSFGGGGAGGDW